MSKRAEERGLEALPPRWRKTKDGKGKVDSALPVRKFYIRAYEQAEKDLADIAAFSSGPDGFYYGKGYQQGKKDAENHLGWHPSTEHPPVDEEVIVLLGRYEDFPQIAFGHIVDQNIAIDFNGWNIPGVKYWMPMPKIPNEDE